MILIAIFCLLQVALSFNINIYNSNNNKYVGSINKENKCVAIKGRGFKYSNHVLVGYRNDDCTGVCRQNFVFKRLNNLFQTDPVRVCDGDISFKAVRQRLSACKGSNQWKRKGRCFTEFSTKVSWSDALERCNSFGLGLATLRDTADNVKLTKRITSDVFIGLNDRITEGKWTWSSGASTLNMFRKGASGSDEPNGGRNENCAVVVKSWGGLWNDANCDTQASFVCSVDSRIGVKYPHPYCARSNQIRIHGKCFTILSQARSWTDSVQACAKRGMTLATMRNKAEQDKIAAMSQFSRLWIGLNDPQGTFNWKWSDGSAYVYKDWNAGEPNSKGQENCVEISNIWNWKWNNLPCSFSDSIYPVCEVAIHKLPLPSKWIVNGRAFYLFSAPRSWREAKAICESNGLTLATIRDETDSSILFSKIKDPENKDTTRVWIGLSNLVSHSTTFDWVSGTDSYRNWAKDEPNNMGGNENCVEIYSVNGKMNDLACNQYRPFVCQSDAVKIKFRHDRRHHK